MAKPRSFALINSAGDRLSLSTYRDTGIATINPKGLGISFTNTTEDYSTAQIVKARRGKLPDFEIDIVLGLNWANATPRKLYNDLVAFLDKTNASGHYTLEYENDVGTYYKLVSLIDLPMTDIKESQTIQETLKFTQCTLWYQDVVFGGEDPAPERNDGDGFLVRQDDKLLSDVAQAFGRAFNTQGFKYHGGTTAPDDVGIVMSSNRATSGTGGVFDLHNDSKYLGLQDSSPMSIIIRGSATNALPYANPYWEIVDDDGKVLATDAYSLNVAKGQQLEIFAGFGRNRAKLVDQATGFEDDAYQKQDHSKTNFVQAPLGSSQLRLHTTNNVAIKAEDVIVTMRKEYVLVG